MQSLEKGIFSVFLQKFTKILLVDFSMGKGGGRLFQQKLDFANVNRHLSFYRNHVSTLSGKKALGNGLQSNSKQCKRRDRVCGISYSAKKNPFPKERIQKIKFFNYAAAAVVAVASASEAEIEAEMEAEMDSDSLMELDSEM